MLWRNPCGKFNPFGSHWSNELKFVKPNDPFDPRKPGVLNAARLKVWFYPFWRKKKNWRNWSDLVKNAWKSFFWFFFEFAFSKNILCLWELSSFRSNFLSRTFSSFRYQTFHFFMFQNIRFCNFCFIFSLLNFYFFISYWNSLNDCSIFVTFSSQIVVKIIHLFWFTFLTVYFINLLILFALLTFSFIHLIYFLFIFTTDCKIIGRKENQIFSLYFFVFYDKYCAMKLHPKNWRRNRICLKYTSDFLRAYNVND